MCILNGRLNVCCGLPLSPRGRLGVMDWMWDLTHALCGSMMELLRQFCVMVLTRTLWRNVIEFLCDFCVGEMASSWRRVWCRRDVTVMWSSVSVCEFMLRS